MKLPPLRISHKLWGAILLLQGAVLAVAGSALFSAMRIERQAQDEQLQAMELVQLTAQWKGMTETDIVRNIASWISADPAVADYFKADYLQSAEKIGALRREVLRRATSPAEQALGQQITERGKALLALAGRARAAAEEGNQDEVNSLIRNEQGPATRAYLEGIDQMAALQRDKTVSAAAQAEAGRRHVLLLAGLGGVLVVGLGAVTAALLARSIRRPLQVAVASAHAIAAGDLTRDLGGSRRDEFGELMAALRHMTGALADTVGKVRASSDSISLASREIAAGNADLSHRTEHAASNLQQTASAVAQLTSTVSHSAESATAASQLARSAASVAQKGGEAVTQVVNTMADIQRSSHKIADIIGVIDGIAFQTNILALNAAVEAARAGEQGRGFAVVAGEVRGLAQRSAEAAREIKGLIHASVERVETGTQLVNGAGNTMEEIVASVRRVSDMIGEISAAAAEQNQSIGQVHQAVDELDQMTQQNAALVEQASAAAESLKTQAHQLVGAMAGFSLPA